MQKEKVFVDAAKKVLVIEGQGFRKEYRFAYEEKPKLKGHIGNAVAVPIGADYEDRLKKAAHYLAANSPNLSVEEIIREALRLYPPRDLARLERSMGRKVKPVKESGCVSLNMAGQVITIVP